MSTTHHCAPSIPLVSLTTAEVRRLVKPHAGFDAYAEELIALYESHVESLGRANLDVQTLLDTLAAYRELRDVELAARAHLARVRQTRLKYGSTVWAGMLEIYARATTASRTDGIIERAIDRFRRFMKHAPRKKAVDPGPVRDGGR